jgi:uncharacterized protein YecE (DUF72 family)
MILIGTSSWTDPTILKSGWYPPEANTPEQRLAHYAKQFPLVEVDSTYYAMPSERNSALWAERTPDSFTFNIKAFSLMTGHSTTLNKLPSVVRDSLPPDLAANLAAGKRNIYLRDLPAPAQRWIWEAFERALLPLKESGKLGAILLQFPPWFGISRTNQHYVEHCREMLPDCQLAVEFRNRSWLEERNAAETLRLLETNHLSFVCVDEPQGFRSSVPPVTVVTEPHLAMLRLHGRNTANWEAKGISAAERFRYLYGDEELDEVAPRVRELAEKAEQTHVLFNNCYSDFGVRNAAQLASKLDLE